MTARAFIIFSAVFVVAGCRTTREQTDSDLLFSWSTPITTKLPDSNEYLVTGCRTQAAAIGETLRHAAIVFDIDISALRSRVEDDYSAVVTIFVLGRHDDREQAYRIDQSGMVGYHGAWTFYDVEGRPHNGEISSTWNTIYSDENCQEWSNLTRFASGRLMFQFEKNNVDGFMSHVPIEKGRWNGRQQSFSRKGFYGYREFEHGQLHGVEESFFPDGSLESRLRHEHGVMVELYSPHEGIEGIGIIPKPPTTPAESSE